MLYKGGGSYSVYTIVKDVTVFVSCSLKDLRSENNHNHSVYSLLLLRYVNIEMIRICMSIVYRFWYAVQEVNCS